MVALAVVGRVSRDGKGDCYMGASVGRGVRNGGMAPLEVVQRRNRNNIGSKRLD